jgi:hypothetical protein
LEFPEPCGNRHMLPFSESGACRTPLLPQEAISGVFP